MSTVEPLPSGVHLGDEFRIERKLGQGGFGITYLVRALKDLDDAVRRDDLCVVKECAIEQFVRREPGGGRLEPAGDTESERERNWRYFEKYRDGIVEEARMLARFQHLNIVEVLFIRMANNTAYIIMEHINGESLQARINAEVSAHGRGLNFREFEPIAAALVEALEHVHEHDIIHRDIKPDNVMLRSNGAPVLIDFGGARPQERARGSIVYTPGFAPFEQQDGDFERIGKPTDIYSMAATFYAALTGHPPYSVDQQRRARFAPSLASYPNKAAQGIPDSFARAVDSALEFSDPTLRPQTARDWRRALFPPNDAVARGPAPEEDVSAHSTTTLERVEVKSGGRLSAILGLSMAGVAVLGAGALAYLYLTGKLLSERGPPVLQSGTIVLSTEWTDIPLPELPPGEGLGFMADAPVRVRVLNSAGARGVTDDADLPLWSVFVSDRPSQFVDLGNLGVEDLAIQARSIDGVARLRLAYRSDAID